MKRILLSLLLTGLLASCKAQQKGTVSVYGFKQAVLPGILPGDLMTDDGRVIQQEFKPKFNLFIYTASKNNITPVEVWLEGKRYAVVAEPVANTPVQYTNPTAMPKPGTITLVPKTSKKVLRIALTEAERKKPLLQKSGIAKENELVIVYKQGNQTYYVTMKGLTEIEPVAMQ